MKRVILLLAICLSGVVNAAEISAYYSVKSSLSLSKAKLNVESKLKTKQFTIIGEYSPMNNPNYLVIAFTRNDLQKLTVSNEAIGSLASVLKIGIIQQDNKTTISLLNPEYIFNAYLQDDIEKVEQPLKKISDELQTLLVGLGSNFVAFGGKLAKDDLRDYHYMFGMPYLTDYVVLNEFSDYATGCSFIENKLKNGQGTKKVFIQKYPSKKVAVYGIALTDKNSGENFFLKKIGVSHIAAMPYEIIVLGKKAIMLHGRYRFALLWPELSMSEFMQIVDTPGYVEDTFAKLTK